MTTTIRLALMALTLLASSCGGKGEAHRLSALPPMGGQVPPASCGDSAQPKTDWYAPPAQQ